MYAYITLPFLLNPKSIRVHLFRMKVMYTVRAWLDEIFVLRCREARILHMCFASKN